MLAVISGSAETADVLLAGGRSRPLSGDDLDKCALDYAILRRNRIQPEFHFHIVDASRSWAWEVDAAKLHRRDTGKDT